MTGGSSLGFWILKLPPRPSHTRPGERRSRAIRIGCRLGVPAAVIVYVARAAVPRVSGTAPMGTSTRSSSRPSRRSLPVRSADSLPRSMVTRRRTDDTALARSMRRAGPALGGRYWPLGVSTHRWGLSAVVLSAATVTSTRTTPGRTSSTVSLIS